MTLSPAILDQANAIIGDVYSDLTNKGAVQTYIPQSTHTNDFPLPDQLVLRAVQEKDVVYYNIFRTR